jgi:hypothetical protein
MNSPRVLGIPPLEISILNGGIELLMLQVDPGYEYEIAMELQEAKIGMPFKAIGKYDLLCIRTFQDEPKGINLLRTQHFSRIVDYEHFVTFLWDTGNSARLYSCLSQAEVPKTHWCSVTLSKTNPTIFMDAEHPVEREFTLAVKGIEDVLSGKVKDYLVLGSLGWFNNIIMIWNDDITEIANAILEIERLTTDGQTIILKGFTIFNLSYAFIFTDKQGKTLKAWELLDNTSQNIRPELLVTCTTGQTAGILTTIKEEFDAPGAGVTFGSEDLLMTETTLPLGQYLKKLLDFRKKSGKEEGLILATTTRFKFRSPTENTHSPKLLPQDGKIKEAFAKERENLSKNPDIVIPVPFGWEPLEISLKDTSDLHKRFSLMYLSAVQNPLICDAYVDMLVTLSELKKRSGELQISERLFRDILLYLNIAYQQRSLGTLNSPWNFGNAVPLFYRGSIHRVIWAVEGLIDSLLRQAGKEWKGFVVFGLSADYLRSHIGVITVPLRTVFDPGEWWGIFHEVGHEYTYDCVKNQEPQKLQDLLDEIVDPGKTMTEGGDQLARQYILNYIWEAVSDIFDLRSGFLSNWELYKETVTDYLVHFSLAGELKEIASQNYAIRNTHLGKLVLDYLSRFLAVYIYRTGITDTTVIENSYNSFYEEIVSYMERRLVSVIENTLPALSKDKADRFSKEFGQLVQLNSLKEYFMNVGYHRLVCDSKGRDFLETLLPQQPDEELISSTHQLMKELEAGCILSSLPYPQLAICKLKQSGKPTYRFKIATILTLWNMYARRLPDKVAEVFANS